MLKLIEKMPFNALAWPGNWVWTDDNGASFEVVRFCRCFSGGENLPAKLHISADNRYKLYIDGCFVGLGPQRGTLERYFFDTYDLSDMKAGSHTFTALVWHERDTAPSAQITSRPGFLAVSEYSDGTFRGTLEGWKYKRWFGNGTIPVPEDAYCIGMGYDMAGFTVEDLCPAADEVERDFSPVRPMGYSRDHQPGHPQLLLHWILNPRTIPAMRAEKNNLGQCRRLICDGDSTYQGSLQYDISQLAASSSKTANTVIIPAHSRYRILLDNEKLVAGYPTILVSYGRGASVSMTYQEALQANDDVRSKGNRNEVGQRMLVGTTDRFTLQGRNDVILEPLWWRCWRYIELDIETSDEAIELKELTYRSTGYPLELNAKFESDEWFSRLIEPGFRTMELCASETYMDCPYYEQLQYIGDTRIQALLSYVLCDDDRLAREAIKMFDQSIGFDGLTQCSYPNRFKQTIPLFSLLYIPMLNDFLMWRGDIDFIRRQLPGVETILRTYERCVKDDGLMGKLPGWAFVDWPKDASWKNGEPPAASQGNSYLVSFFYLYALQHAARLCQLTGDMKRAGRFDEQAKDIQNILREKSFDAQRQIFIDEPDGQYISQHTNIFAILTDTHIGVIDGKVLLKNILSSPKAVGATVYFKFYLYEAMYQAGCGDLIWPDLKLWNDMVDNGLTTFAEKPEPTRSDCHGWSSHPLYHFIASILGIRPTAPGCSAMSVRPLPRTKTVPPLPQTLSVRFNTVKGQCSVRLKAGKDGWDIYKEIPSGTAIS